MRHQWRLALDVTSFNCYQRSYSYTKFASAWPLLRQGGKGSNWATPKAAKSPSTTPPKNKKQKNKKNRSRANYSIVAPLSNVSYRWIVPALLPASHQGTPLVATYKHVKPLWHKGKQNNRAIKPLSFAAGRNQNNLIAATIFTALAGFRLFFLFL